MTGIEIMAVAAVVSAVTAVGGTALSIQAQRQQEKGQQANLEYQAKLQERNAQIARQNAGTVTQQGEVAVQAKRREVAAHSARQRAAFAGSGVDISAGGTVSDVLGDTKAFGDLDALTIEHNAELQARNIQQQAQGFDIQAGLQRQQSQQIKAGSGLRTAGTVLTGLGQVAGAGAQFASFKK